MLRAGAACLLAAALALSGADIGAAKPGGNGNGNGKGGPGKSDRGAAKKGGVSKARAGKGRGAGSGNGASGRGVGKTTAGGPSRSSSAKSSGSGGRGGGQGSSRRSSGSSGRTVAGRSSSGSGAGAGNGTSGSGPTRSSAGSGSSRARAASSGGGRRSGGRGGSGGGGQRGSTPTRAGSAPGRILAPAPSARILGPASGSPFAGATPVGPLAAAPGGSAPGLDIAAGLPEVTPVPAAAAPVVRTVREFVQVIPPVIWFLVATLGGLTLLLAASSWLLAARQRRLERQREALLEDVGFLQRALLSPPPEQMAGISSSVAYLPADDREHRGHFEDVFTLEGDRLGVVIGDLSEHGRSAVGLGALVRHTVRAYLEAGMEPRLALQVASRVLEGKLADVDVAATAAVYDRESGRLVYSAAGHPPPVVLGAAAFEPVFACGSPPLGAGRRTGLRQTSLVLPPGSLACFYTRGLVDGPVGGEPLGYRGLSQAATELGTGADAAAVLERVAAETDRAPDAAAVCVLRVAHHVRARSDEVRRVEELELSRQEVEGEVVTEFLAACGVPSDSVEMLAAEFREAGARLGGGVLQVRVGPGVPSADLGLRRSDVLSASFAA